MSSSRRASLERDLRIVGDKLGERALRNHPLGRLTTYRVGGDAALYQVIEDADDLDRVRAALLGSSVPLLVVGNGSNMLVSESGFCGLVVKLGSGFSYVRPLIGVERGEVGEVLVETGGATDLPVLARKSVEAGLSGLEWAVGIPGTVGGAVRMNAGGHGSDVAACIARCEWTELGSDRRGDDGPGELGFGYRSSRLPASAVVTKVEFRARAGDRDHGRSILSEIVRWRRSNQPGGSNAGSVFTNPPEKSAGELIEAAGLKGYRLGSASVSRKHANFIQADAGGSATDVYNLICYVAGRVLEHSGVTLYPELRLIGFEDEEGGDVSDVREGGARP